MARPTPGIVTRHGRSCPSREGGACGRPCEPSFEAWVYDQRTGKKIRRSFRNLTEAKGWRSDASGQLRRGTLAAPSRLTVRQAAERWVEQAKAGEALTRSGKRYKPSVIRTHEGDLERYVLPRIGTVRLDQLRRRDVQALVDHLIGKGLSGSKVRNAVMPLRVICRRAIERDELTVNPTANLSLPEGAGRRDRAASPAEAAELLDALPEAERPLWATAFYAGLRRGELRALRWEDVDERVTVIHVRRGWDDVEGEIEPKSRKGERRVPIGATLRPFLLAHKARTGRRDGDLVFGRTRSEPFTPSHVRAQARKAWAKYRCGCKPVEGAKACEEHKLEPFEPIGLHEARHTYVSLMHAAGLSLERIGDYVGHSSTYMTDAYRHLLDGHEEEAALMLDRYLAGRLTG